MIAELDALEGEGVCGACGGPDGPYCLCEDGRDEALERLAPPEWRLATRAEREHGEDTLEERRGLK